MSATDALTIAALLLALASLGGAVGALVDIGGDRRGFGPWRRPPPSTPPERLPADFIAVWSLYGDRSLRTYAGSWEAAVRRLDNVEEHIAARSSRPHTTMPSPPHHDPVWLEQRITHLERLAGLLDEPDGDRP